VDKKTNSYERLIDALTFGPQPIDSLKKIVGAGVQGRISEFNKIYGSMFVVTRTNGVAKLERTGRIKSNYKLAYPQYYVDGVNKYSKKGEKNG